MGETTINGFEIPEEIHILAKEDLEVWETDILDIIHQKPDKRTINWFWEENGGIGKTEFCKYLVMTEQDVLYVNGKSNDMKYAISKFVEKHNRGPKVLCCDFPRDYEKYVSYIGIEELKNGIFFSGKYESGMVVFNTPHILCFANFPPQMFRLSQDRWNIVHLVFNET